MTDRQRRSLKEIKCRLGIWLASLSIWVLVHVIGRTGRLSVRGFGHVTQLLESRRGFLMAVWHGRTLLPIYYCRGMGIWAITSLSADGELQTRILSRFGFRIIRGSSARGGIKAALVGCRKLQEGGMLAITPDGPRGPANEVQSGILFMAQRSGCPIIPIGAEASPKKLVRTWDSYLIPMPFARCAIVFGEPIYLAESESKAQEVPPDDVLKAALNEVQREAQLMVEEAC